MDIPRDGGQGGFRGVKLPRATGIKNKQVAPVQITAEQILREASERQETEIKPPRQKITDPEELEQYRSTKRKGFEDNLRRQRTNPSIYIKYAKWEESQGDLERARSIFERAIDVNYRNVTIWLNYVEMEMRWKNVNSARNIWDRAVTLLPRVDQLWYKYAFMEETLGNFAGARQVFERWMQWNPEQNAWSSYIKFERRHNELERARELFRRFVASHPTVKSWLKWARFEEEMGNSENARSVYEKALEDLGEEAHEESLFLAFARFEESSKEFERARVVFKYALDHLPKEKAVELYKTFLSFEKKHGNKEGIEEVIYAKRRLQYEEEVRVNPRNYDAWFDYIRLEELQGDTERIREVYERAISNIPPQFDAEQLKKLDDSEKRSEKKRWSRYIYLWIYYAVYTELQEADAERTREIYNECLKLIPHSRFTFAKVWILFAQFEVRVKNLQNARKIYGTALGLAPSERSSNPTSTSRTNWPTSIGAELSTRNTLSGILPTATPGWSLPRWRLHFSNLIEFGRSSSLPSHNRCWTCPNSCGRPTSTSRSNRRNTKR
eukprot:TRINITY_DN3838_c0_g1_i2.p1 TRINITY_DN3838_c0_g1~~TRINITY_DN3838_c0_g1_i2.p1  ORF type:complete len:553 (+),score=91.11 TRINITY_DN3838_c0_g1_i2:138-1796(+)